jgi:hypothetical protein
MNNVCGKIMMAVEGLKQEQDNIQEKFGPTRETIAERFVSFRLISFGF